MPVPGEHKTTQARILAYAQEIGWTYVPRGEAGKNQGRFYFAVLIDECDEDI